MEGRFFKDNLSVLGVLGIGTDDPQRLVTLYKSSTPVLQLVNSTTGTGTGDGFLLLQGGLNTTLENSEAGYMAFRTSANEKMRIDASGNVGIGTTNPSEKLEISIGNVFVNGNNGQGIKLGSTNGIFRQASNELGFNTNNSERMRIDASGNVGIGNPADSGGNGALSSLVTLRIGGTGTINSDAGQGLLQLRGYSANVNQNVGTIEFVDDRNGTDDIIGRINSSRDTSIGDGNLKFSTATSAGVLSEAMRIDSSGNVGIGTTAPSDKLHVVQNVDLNTALFKNTSGRAQVIIDSQSTTQNSYLTLSNGGSEFAFLDANTSTNLLRIATNNTGAEIAIETNSQDEAVRIDSTGNVGIGTTNPSAKLDVNGDSELNGVVSILDGNDIPLRVESSDSTAMISIAMIYF